MEVKAIDRSWVQRSIWYHDPVHGQQWWQQSIHKRITEGQKGQCPPLYEWNNCCQMKTILHNAISCAKRAIPNTTRSHDICIILTLLHGIILPRLPGRPSLTWPLLIATHPSLPGTDRTQSSSHSFNSRSCLIVVTCTQATCETHSLLPRLSQRGPAPDEGHPRRRFLLIRFINGDWRLHNKRGLPRC